MSLPLELVVERYECFGIRVQCGRDQPVGEPGVLGKQRAVQIGPHHGARTGALEATAAVVPVAFEDTPEGSGARA